MDIRKTKVEDLDRVMEMYAHARTFMKEHGNPNQWCKNNWPPRELIEEDIKIGRSYVCVEDDGSLIGTFCYMYGDHIDHCYDKIYDGEWTKDIPYGVVHRITSDGPKGTGSFMINWAFSKCHYLRIDTHPDNIVMRNLLTKLGFTQCGVIYVEQDDAPRYSFDKYEEVI